MSDFAKITATGRLTKDAQTFKAGESTKTVFAIAVNRSRKTGEDNGKPVYEKLTTFIECCAWNNSHIAEFGKKGVSISVEGDWETDTYTPKGKEPVTRSQINVRNAKIFSAQPKVAAPSKADDEGPSF